MKWFPRLNVPHGVRLAFSACAGGLAAAFALSLVPPVHHELGPARVAARAAIGAGATRVAVPPLGTVAADTHRSPLAVTVTINEIDPEPLARAVSLFGARRDLIASIADDLRGAAVRLGIRLALGAVLIGALIGALLPRRSFGTIGTGAAGGLAVITLGLGGVAATFDVAAFEEPRFEGALQQAPQVIKAVNREVGSLDQVRSRFETAAERLGELLTLTADPTRSPREGSIAILHVSDIHSNPAGVEVVKRLARSFQVDAVLDTGDLTSFGYSIETRIGELLDDIPAPYLFVPGNHDSTANRRALGRVDNVTLLDGDIVTVEGVRILGWADPTFTARNEITTEEGNAERRRVAPEVAAAVAAQSPDVLAVHDVRLAEDAFGEIPLVVAGHTHRRSLEVRDETIVSIVGSTGATGLGSFLVETEVGYEAEVLYFREGAPVAIDYVSFDGLNGDFTVERRSLDSLTGG
ncbi:MAG TPA: metallophosphoesterase [Actinomycetota bacterium]|nr:metallophosphoesterase [Actinomycetota bacterium]